MTMLPTQGAGQSPDDDGLSPARWVVLVVGGVVVSFGLIGILSLIPLAGGLPGTGLLEVAMIGVATGIVGKVVGLHGAAHWRQAFALILVTSVITGIGLGIVLLSYLSP